MCTTHTTLKHASANVRLLAQIANTHKAGSGTQHAPVLAPENKNAQKANILIGRNVDANACQPAALMDVGPAVEHKMINFYFINSIFVTPFSNKIQFNNISNLLTLIMMCYNLPPSYL